MSWEEEKEEFLKKYPLCPTADDHSAKMIPPVALK